MNRIYWGTDQISMLTDHLDATSHSHYMIQFFLGISEDLLIKVADKKFSCPGIIVNKNVKHSFRTNNMLHITCLFEPVSDLAVQLTNLLQDKEYYIFNDTDVKKLRQSAQHMIVAYDKEAYQMFMDTFRECCGITLELPKYDERIVQLIDILRKCTCENHMIERYANELAISSSRLSHLFREQVGIPLKNYLLLHQLEHAFLDLLAGKKITEAAMNAGFDSPSHFAATVKRMMGLPARSTIKDSEFLKVY